MKEIQIQGLDAMPMRLHARDEGHANYGVALVKAVEYGMALAADQGHAFCLSDAIHHMHNPPGRTNMRRPIIRPDDWIYAITHVSCRYPEIVPLLWNEVVQCHSDIIVQRMRQQLVATNVSLPQEPEQGRSR